MKKHRLKLLVIAMGTLLLVGNPSEETYLATVAEKFGSLHHGMKMTTSDLEEIGSSRYQSYGFFSLYSYRFGTIQVNYFGFAFGTYYQGSETSSSQIERNLTQTT